MNYFFKTARRQFFIALGLLLAACLSPSRAGAQSAPNITSQPQSRTVGIGSNAVFSVAASSSQTPLTYRWSFNATDLTNSLHLGGATNSSLTVSNLIADDAGSYSVVVTDRNSRSTTSSVATLTIGYTPAITNQPVSQIQLAGGTASFSANASGTAPLGFRWFRNALALTNNARISGATNIALAITSLLTNDSGNYTFVASNTFGTATSFVANLDVRLTPAAIVRYVNLNNPSPTPPYGTWSSAATNIQDAIDVAGAGEQILVTNGVYANSSREIPYSGVTNRVVVAIPLAIASVNGGALTWIDGGGMNRCIYLTNGATLNGFTLTNGYSQSDGGGALCAATNTVVTDCIFAGNRADGNGGAVSGGTVNSCLLVSNSCNFGGGAAYSFLNNCTLTGNSGLYGAGAAWTTLNHCQLNSNSSGSIGGGVASSTLNNCTLLGNIAANNGGAGIYSTFTNCTLSANSASSLEGGGVDASTLYGCTLSNNYAGQWGGNAYGSTLDNCLVTGGSCFRGGGANNCTLNNCMVSNNVSFYSDGGGAYACTLSNCVVTGNSAGYTGGGANASTLINCLISSNSAPYGGGVIGCVLTNCTLTGNVMNNPGIGAGGAANSSYLYNCLLTGNSSVLGGGGASQCTLVNCTVTGNSAASTGGGVDSSVLTNCIVYYNTAGGGGANYSGINTVVYTCTTPLPASGAGNFSSAPQFENQPGGNYRLYPGSPCINAGNNTAMPLALDLDGNARVVNSTVDMGAYEFQNSPFITGQPQNQTVPYGEPFVSFSVTAVGPAPLTYQWRFNGTNLAGATNDTLTLNFIQFSYAGNYSVTVMNSYGSALSSNAVLTVNPAVAPQIVSSPTSQTALTNVNLTLAAAATGAPTPAVRWYFNNVALADDARHTGTATPTLNLLNTQTNDTGGYWLVATNVAGTATSSVATVSILLPPSFLQQPAGQTVPTSSNPAFTATVTGGNPLAYQWYFNGTPLTDDGRIAGATTTNLVIGNAQFTDSGNYILIATNPVGSAASATAVLAVLSPPIFITQPSGHTNAVGSNTVFIASITGSTPINYQWFFNDAILTNDSRITGATTTNLFITSLQTNDIGNYQLVAGNAIGVITSTIAFLDVEFPPAITQPPASQTNVTASIVAFTVGASGSEPLRYQWFFNGTALTNDARISGASSSALIISNVQTADAGNYLVIVTNWVGAATGAVAVFTVIPPPVITLQPTNLLRAVGSNLIFTAAATGAAPLVFQWLFNGVPLTNDSHFAGTDTTSLSILAALTNDIGGYQFVVTNIGGSVTSSVANLALLFPPTILVPPLAQAIGASSNAVFSVVAGGDGPFTYRWRFSGAGLTDSARISGSTNDSLTVSNLVFADTGNYDVVVSNLVGVVASPAAALTVNIAPAITSQSTNRVVALGLPLNLSVTATGTAPLVYQWSLNGTNLPAATSAAYFIPAMTVNDYGIYQLTVTNAFGAATSAPVQIAPSQLVAWGNNSSGQTNLPFNLTNIVAIAAGGIPYSAANGPNGFNLVLLADGSLLAWGNNTSGQTNIPASATNIVAIAAGAQHSLALRADGTVLAWGLNGNGQTNVPATLSNVVAIAAGGYHNVALRSDGKVFCWGLNANGQTNVPSTLTRVVSIAAGPYHTLAVRADGTVVAWGLNTNDRQLAGAGSAMIPPGLSDIKLVAGGYYHNLALRNNGTLFGWASTNYGLDIIPASASNVTAIAAGNYFNLALRANGLVSAWGRGEYGQTNVPAGLSNAVAVAAGSGHALALVNDGRPMITRQPVGGTSWLGRSYTLSATVVGQSPLTLQWQLNGTNISGATNALLALNNLDSTQAGSYQLLASNALGLAASVPVPLTLVSSGLAFLSTLPTPVTNFVGGKIWLNAAVAGNGPVNFQWRFNGANLAGATNEDLAIEPLVQTNGGIYSMIASNALTGNSITSLNTTQQVALVRAWGYLATSPTNAALTNIIALAAGYAGAGSSVGYYWGLRADGKLIGWGTSSYNEGSQPASVSNFTVTAIAAGFQHSLALRSDGNVVDWGQNIYGLPTIPAAAVSITAIACGDYHDMALRSDGTVVVWGISGYSLTNVPASVTNIVAIAAGQNACYALRLDGKVINWGASSAAVPATLSNVVAIASGAGSSVCYALKADGTVTNWGLGTAKPPTIPPDWTNIVAISSSYQHANALRADGIVLTTGNYYNGTTSVPSGMENVIAIASGGDHDLALFSPRTPGITLQPLDRTVFKGSTIAFHARAAAPLPATSQWYFNGAALNGATNPSLTIANAQLASSGAYQFVVSNRYGVTASKTAKLFVMLPLGESLDTADPFNNWSSSGNTPWFGQATTTHDGVDAAQSGGITHSQETILQNVITNTSLANGMLSFWWKVSSEAIFDTLEFRLNGVVQAVISGEIGWQKRFFEVPVGVSTLQWRYSKDAGGNAGQNAAWVDQFNLTFGPPVIILQPQPPHHVANAGDSTSFGIDATGGGGSLTYYWRQNLTNAVGGNSSLLTLDNVTRTNSGLYSCLVSNVYGVAISSNLLLTVLVPQVLGSPQLLPDGSFQLSSTDATGGSLAPADLANFEAQASTDLVNWVTLPGALSLTNGLLQLQDNGSNYNARYYRIIEH